MTSDQSRWQRLFRESFIPVVIVIAGLFLILLYVQFRSEYEAEKVTVIDIQPVAPMASENEAADAGDEPGAVASDKADPEQARARELLAQKKWKEAERLYLAVLARQRTPHAFRDLGVLYMKQGDFPRALKYFNRALEMNPSYPSALFNGALTLARSGRKREALEGYRALLAKQPDHYQGQYNLGELLAEQGDKAGGAAAMEKAAQLSGGKHKAHALYQLGLLRRELGQSEAAAKAFEEAIRLQPDSPEPRTGLATLEPDTADGQARALAQYHKILELDPDYAPALVNMAVILKAQNKREEAVQALRLAIQADADDTRAHTNLGLLLLEERHWQDARAEFEWVLQHDKTRADAHFNLGRIAYAQKDYGAAISAYQSALKAASGNYPEAFINLGLAHAARNEFGPALSAYQSALKLRKDYPEAWYNIGMAWLRQENNARAQEAFNNAVHLRPNYEQAWFNLGVIYASENRDTEAIKAYRRALSIRPDYTQAQINLAVRYAKRKDYEEAIRLYREVLAREDSYAVAWFDLGNAYLGNRQLGESVAAFRKAAELDPSNTKTLRLLGHALLMDGKGEEAVKVLQNAVAADSADVRLRLELVQALRQTGHADDAQAEFAKAKQLDPNARLEAGDAPGNESH